MSRVYIFSTIIVYDAIPYQRNNLNIELNLIIYIHCEYKWKCVVEVKDSLVTILSILPGACILMHIIL